MIGGCEIICEFWGGFSKLGYRGSFFSNLLGDIFFFISSFLFSLSLDA
jgi:hypothetical protein